MYDFIIVFDESLFGNIVDVWMQYILNIKISQVIMFEEIFQ